MAVTRLGLVAGVVAFARVIACSSCSPPFFLRTAWRFATRGCAMRLAENLYTLPKTPRTVPAHSDNLLSSLYPSKACTWCAQLQSPLTLLYFLPNHPRHCVRPLLFHTLLGAPLPQYSQKLLGVAAEDSLLSWNLL